VPGVGQPSNVPREPYQGEIKETEALVQGAPLAGAEEPPPTPAPEIQENPILAVNEEQAQQLGAAGNPGNLSVGGATDFPVLTRPARPMTRNEIVSTALKSLAFASPMVRRLGTQIGGLETSSPQGELPPGQGPADVISGAEAETVGV